MAPRAVWKGFLTLAAISCPVALYKAVDEPTEVSFSRFNRKTGNKIEQQTIDSLTGELIARDDIARGFEVAKGRYVEITDEDLASCAPPSAQALDIMSFVDPATIDVLHIVEHYTLAPDGEAAHEAFSLIRTAMERNRVVALAPWAKGSHERLVVLSPCGRSLGVTVLRTAAEIRNPIDAFKNILGAATFDKDLLPLADRIVEGAIEAFDPNGHTDRYQEAIVELVKDRIAGKAVKPPTTDDKPPRMVDLRAAVTKSAERARAKSKRKSA